MKRKTIIAVVAAVIVVLAAGTAFATGQIARNNAITSDNAANLAIVDAGVLPEDAEITELEFKYDHGRFVYEVEFFAKGVEYEYKLDSVSGMILEKESKEIPGYAEVPTSRNTEKNRNNQTTTAAATIGIDKAKKIAFADAGVEESEVILSKAKLDRENGKQIYDIEFYIVDRAEYEYEIDASTGEILEKGFELINKPNQNQGSENLNQEAVASQPAPQTVNTQTPEQARPQTQTETPPTQTNPAPAKTPTETPAAPENPAQSSAGNSEPAQNAQTTDPANLSKQEMITIEQAKQMALQQAGVSADQVVFEKAKLDREDGVLIYEVEFYIQGSKEYEADVDAYSGIILDFEVEDWDD